MAGSLFSYCACRSPGTGKRYKPGECPKPARHRRWGFVVDQERIWDEEGQRWRRQQLKRMGFATRKAAEDALDAEVPAIREGTAPSLADRQLTLGAFLDHWLRLACSPSGEPWRPATAATHRAMVRNYLRPGLGHIRLVALRPEHVTAMVQRIRDGKLRPDAGRRDTGGKLSAGTVSQVAATLRSALNQAVRERRITWNPCAAVRVAGPDRKPVAVWEPRHVRAFLAHAREAEPALCVAFQLSAWRGLRRGELAGLQWADLDLDGGTLRVVRNVTEVDGRLHVGEPKTERGKRTVSLGAQLVAALRAHRRVQAAGRLAAGGKWEDGGWVFPGGDGRLLAPHVLTHRFAALRKDVPGLPPLHLHGLRHTAATHMLLAGVEPKTVQDQLGHATLAMTMDTYGHCLPQQRDASADAIERLYEGEDGTGSAGR